MKIDLKRNHLTQSSDNLNIFFVPQSMPSYQSFTECKIINKKLQRHRKGLNTLKKFYLQKELSTLKNFVWKLFDHSP